MENGMSIPLCIKYIAANPVFEDYSPEELRYFDYLQTGVCFPAMDVSAGSIQTPFHLYLGFRG